MEEKILEIIETLDSLLEELPIKAKSHMEGVLKDLNTIKGQLNVNLLMKIQDDLEFITNIQNVDNYSRNEIMNAIAEIESLYIS